MRLRPTKLSPLLVAEAQPFADERGEFSRWFCTRELAGVFGQREIMQINHSRTSRIGAVRGLHFQHPPAAEIKFVRCIRGRVWDVAVDLRQGSPTLLRWHAEELSPDNGRMMVIPEGFAHGFQVLEEESELLYLHTAFYTPEAEGGVRFDDPAPGIDWPLAVTDVSGRDRNHPLLDENFAGMQV